MPIVIGRGPGGARIALVGGKQRENGDQNEVTVPTDQISCGAL